MKTALDAIRPNAKVVFEEYAPQNTTDFTASAQRLFDALKDKPGSKIIDDHLGRSSIRCRRSPI